MKNKILFSLLFIFLLFITIFTIKSSAFTVNYDSDSYDVGEFKASFENQYLIFSRSGNDKIRLDCFSVEPVTINNEGLNTLTVNSPFNWCYIIYDILNHTIINNLYLKNYPASYNIISFNNTDVLQSQIFYSNFDIKDYNGNVVYENNTIPAPSPVPTYFTFIYNYITYNLLMEDPASEIHNFSLEDNTAIFRNGNILTIFTSDDHPTVLFTDNTLYMCSTGNTGLYYYNLITNRCTSDSHYYSNGTSIPISTNKLIYSNFTLYDELNNILFQPPVLSLAAVLDTVEPANIMTEITGLLPVILLLIISCLGLKKAIVFLFRKAQG